MIADCILDVAFVVDTSGSIQENDPPGGPPNKDKIMDFMKAVVRKLKVCIYLE